MSHLLTIVRYIFTGIVAVLVVLLIVTLEGCTVGPKYAKPSTPMTPAYKLSLIHI